MAHFDRGNPQIPAPVSYCIKAVLLACLPFLIYGGYKYGLYHLISTNPAAQFTYFGIAVLYFVGSAPSRRESILTIAGGLGLLFICPLARPSDFAGEALVRAGAFVGIGGLFVMCARAIWSRNRDQALETLARSLIFVVLGIMLATMLAAASDLRPFKYDRFLYGIDVRFGAAISFVVGTWFRDWPSIDRFEIVVYNSLPLAFAVLYAAHIRRAKQSSVDILTMMWLNAILGYGLYFLYPAAGPLYAFGAAFPGAPPPPAHLSLQLIRLNAFPNAMPSLHMAGVVLIWWNARHWKLGGIVALAFMLMTALAAVGFGEHYFIDLLVAFPYALAIQAISTKSDRRFQALALGIAMTACWFLALLFMPKELCAAPVWLMWALAIVTVAIPLVANAKLLAEAPAQVETVPQLVASHGRPVALIATVQSH
jgi:hypothetical protein